MFKIGLRHENNPKYGWLVFSNHDWRSTFFVYIPLRCVYVVLIGQSVPRFVIDLLVAVMPTIFEIDMESNSLDKPHDVGRKCVVTED